MPVNINTSSQPYNSATMTKQAVSRWSSTAKKAALYQEIASTADPQMMKADTIVFDPSEMIGGTSKGMYESDSSHQRVQSEKQMTTVYYAAGALVVFLIVVTFLKRN